MCVPMRTILDMILSGQGRNISGGILTKIKLKRFLRHVSSYGA